MPSTEDVYGGQFLNAALVKSEKLAGKPLTITTVGVQELGREGKRQTKLVVSFSETEKQLVLNKTNAKIVAESYGTDYMTWDGKKIFLTLTRRDFQGSLVDAISVGCQTPAAIKTDCDHVYKPQPDGSLKCLCGKVWS